MIQSPDAYAALSRTPPEFEQSIVCGDRSRPAKQVDRACDEVTVTVWDVPAIVAPVPFKYGNTEITSAIWTGFSTCADGVQTARISDGLTGGAELGEHIAARA
ncbi:hypothetical protein ACWGK1_00505 [Streptomyces wedmorensis]